MFSWRLGTNLEKTDAILPEVRAVDANIFLAGAIRQWQHAGTGTTPESEGAAKGRVRKQGH